MKVKCKYGEGQLIAIDSSGYFTSYKVLLYVGQVASNQIEDRIYHAISVEIQSESGEWVKFARDEIIKPNH